MVLAEPAPKAYRVFKVYKAYRVSKVYKVLAVLRDQGVYKDLKVTQAKVLRLNCLVGLSQ